MNLAGASMTSIRSSAYCFNDLLHAVVRHVRSTSRLALGVRVYSVFLRIAFCLALVSLPGRLLAQLAAPSNVHVYTDDSDGIQFDWTQAPDASTELIYHAEYEPGLDFDDYDVVLPPNVNWFSLGCDPGDRIITVTLISRKQGVSSVATVIHTGHDAPTVYSLYPTTYGSKAQPFTVGVPMAIKGMHLEGATFTLNGNVIPVSNTSVSPINLVFPAGSVSGSLVVSNNWGSTTVPIQFSGQVTPAVGQNPYIQGVTFPNATTVRLAYSLADQQSVDQGRRYYADIGWCSGNSLQTATNCQEFPTNSAFNGTLDIAVPACGQAVVIRAGIVPADQDGGPSDARDVMLADQSPVYLVVPCPSANVRNLRAIAMEGGTAIHMTWQSDLNEDLSLNVNGSSMYPFFPWNRGWADWSTTPHSNYTVTLQSSNGTSLSTTLNSSSPTVLAVIRDGLTTRIYGWNFGSSQAGSSVTADGTTLSPTSWSENEIDVPNDLSNAQLVQVVVNGYSSPPVSGTPPATGTTPTSGPLYSFTIAKPDGSSGYDGVGNVVAYQDQVNQQWSASYDSLNRLKNASQTILATNGTSFNIPGASGVQQYLCWNYDSFGNRTAQVVSNISLADNNTCQPQSSATHDDNLANYDVNNRITSGTGMTGITYDAAGNLQEDGNYTYKYDGEGHLCAVWRHITGVVTGYLYDPEGTRVAKGTVSSFDCPTEANFTVTSQYIPGPDGEQLTELDGSGNWVHTNIFADGSLIATDNSAGRHYQLNDWLGNRRMQVDPNGNVETYYQTAPYGDRLNNQPITTEHLFTGKERDTETGLDYFGARYYGSSLGRFMSPDPSGLAFADPTNPQMLNLYSYTINNPLAFIDPTGLALQQICTQGQESSSDSIDEEGNEVVNVNAGIHCQLVDDGRDPKVTSTISYNALPQYKPSARRFGTPWYKTCTAQALGNGLISEAIDSVGLIPGGKDIEIGAETIARQVGHMKGYRGIVADQYGRRVLTGAGSRLKGAATGISLGQSVTGDDKVSTTLNVLSLIPAFGTVPSMLSMGWDAAKTAKAVYDCQHP